MVLRYVYMSPSSQIARPNVVQQQQPSSDGATTTATTTITTATTTTTTTTTGRAGHARKRYLDRDSTGHARKRYLDRDSSSKLKGEPLLPPLTTRARHRKRCREEAGDVLAQHFQDVGARARAALEMVQATEEHREEAQRLLGRYKDLLAECYPSSIARLSRKWVPFKSADFENADDVILVCREMPLTQGQQTVFKRQLRRLNSHLTGLVAEVDSALVLTGFVAKPLTIEEIRWVLREYKKLLTGALLDFFEDIGLNNDEDDEHQGGPSDNSRITSPFSD